jgi:hypothetical protein
LERLFSFVLFERIPIESKIRFCRRKFVPSRDKKAVA